MMVLQLWIGWIKKKKEVLQLLRLLQHVFGMKEKIELILLIRLATLILQWKLNDLLRVLDGAIALVLCCWWCRAAI